MPSTIRRTSAIAFGVAAVVLLVVSTFGYRTVRRSADANQSVAHTYQVLSALEQVWTTMVDAEAGAGGFSDTGVSRYLESYERANADVGSRVNALATLTADNPVQQQHVAELRTETNATMRLLQQIVSRAKSRGSIPLDLRNPEKANMDGVRAKLQQMRVEEQRFMQQRIDSAVAAETTARALMLAVIAVAFGVLAVSFMFVDRRAVQLRQANELLSERVQERTAELETTLAAEQATRHEAQEARADADAANDSKDLFLARVSHELRTPLNALMGWARMLRDGNVSPDRMSDGIAAIDRNGDVLKKLVDDLVDMSRIRAGKIKLDRRPVDIAAVVQESVDLLESAATEKHIRVETNINAGPITVDGDATRLRQVVWNLLSNAIKFTPPKGTVSLSLRVTDGHVDISVADTGQGITADFLPHVFEPFAQADTSRYQGLGLGLAIVHQLVKAHDGRIGVTSPGVGAGATFTVSLPVVRVPEIV